MAVVIKCNLGATWFLLLGIKALLAFKRSNVRAFLIIKPLVGSPKEPWLSTHARAETCGFATLLYVVSL